MEPAISIRGLTKSYGEERVFMTHDRSIRVAVMGGARTPFARAGTVFRKYSALDLGAVSYTHLTLPTKRTV